MTPEQDISQKPSASIVIVGGGFTGSTIAVQQARHYISLYKKDTSLPPLTICIVDENGSFGPGLPYRTQDDVFLLNQPASAMSPFPDDPDHFTRWLGGDGDAFATRHQYGGYLKETLAETFNAAAREGIPVKLEKLTGRVADVVPAAGSIRIVRDGNPDISAQALVLATGHRKGLFLNELDNGNGKYFSAVQDVKSVNDVLGKKSAKSNVAIVGTGQSMMDVLGILDHIGYRGKIYAFSRSLVLPWAFDPGVYRRRLSPYTPFYLAPERVSKARDRSFRALCRRLKSEFARAERLGYGIGHVLTSIDFEGLAVARYQGIDPKVLEKFRRLWKDIYGNPTPPVREKLLKAYKGSGQLVFVRRRIAAKNFILKKDSFIIKNIKGKRNIRLAAVFNAAAFERNPLSDPLLNSAADKKLLRMQEMSIMPGPQDHPGIFAAGPPTNTQRWGVETFRDNNAAVAQQSVKAALGFKKT